MRKILSGFLATAMVASVCATMALAAAPAVGNTYYIDLSRARTETAAEETTDATATSKIALVLKGGDGKGFKISTASALGVGKTGQDIVNGFAGQSATAVAAGAPATVAAGDITVTNEGNGILKITTSKPGAAYRWEIKDISLTPSSASDDGNLQLADATVRISDVEYARGALSDTVDVDPDSNLAPDQVLVCDLQGNPLAMVKDGGGVDKQINDDGGVQSDKKVYFMIQDNGYNPSVAANVPYGDDKYFKIKVNKGDNAKQVKKISVVEKNVSSSNLIGVESGKPVNGTSGRHRFIEVELNPNYTTDEFKLTFDVRVTPTTSAVDRNYASDSDELKIRDFSVWMKNIERDADNDWKVGINGLMLKPLGNDWNDVTWFDEDGDLAHMKFFADSDVDSFYSKLSTKWVHADYASYFNDQDAYIFDFTGSPKLSATSRADLEIYNPFVDEDGNETIDPSSAVIYQVIDGDLFDVTDNFTYEEAESGDMAFKTRTRFLGTYIICEKAVEEAVDGDAPDTDLVPEDTTPVEVTPGNDDGGKAPANTGKYL